MYTHILITTDGSACSKAAVKQGIDLAQAVQAEVTLLHVVDSLLQGPFQEELKRFGKEALEHANAVAQAAGIQAAVKLVEGFIAPTILKEAEAHDLIVMGSRGRGRVREFLLGSVTQAVLRQAGSPVLVVRCKHDPKLAADTEVHGATDQPIEHLH